MKKLESENVEGDARENGDIGDRIGESGAVEPPKKRRLNEDEKATLRKITQFLLMDSESPVVEANVGSSGEQA